MAKDREIAEVSIRDWPGLVTHADRQGIAPGSGRLQVNLQSDSPRQMRVRRGMTRVQFDASGLVQCLDIVDVQESVAAFLEFIFRNTSDAVSLSDSSFVAFAISGPLAEPVTVTDVMAVERFYTATPSSAVGVTENVYTTQIMTLGITDSILVFDATSVLLASNVIAATSVTVLEMIVAERTFSGFHTPWSGGTDKKLYLQSSQFSSTLRTSQSVSAIESALNDISWDGTNTPWVGSGADKLYLTAGQFTSTLSTSISVNAINNLPVGISWDGGNTPWCGSASFLWKLYLTSGQFSSTLHTSQDVNGVAVPNGISFDGSNTPWASTTKLYLQSSQFSSTIKTSRGVTTAARGISWDGTNTPWCNSTSSKLLLLSGQFSSTIKTSRSTSSIDTFPSGIETNDVLGRI